MNNYFSLQDKVGDILDKYPETLEVFVVNGFEQLKNPIMRKAMAGTITLDMALKMKKVNAEIFSQKLIDAIKQEREGIDHTLREEGSFAEGDIRIEGVLPCPIRIPLMENFTAKLEEIKPTLNKTVGYDLRSASMGIDWLKEQVKKGDDSLLPDVMLSAGFELFFDEKYMKQFMDKKIFTYPNVQFNKDFANEKINLEDPKKEYFVIGVVAAIIMVNEKLLGDRPYPKCWEDLLRPEFENSLALPMKDLDLFNAVILHIHKKFGDEGVKNLARSYQKSLHPAQMVKSKGLAGNINPDPVVSISPYFFTQMLPENGPIKPVWPEDGAIVSPIFMVAKDTEEAKPFLDYFTSKEVGELFCFGGKFPSTNQYVDNKLKENQNFMWLGWDYIHSRDIGSLLKRLESDFKNLIGE